MLGHYSIIMTYLDQTVKDFNDDYVGNYFKEIYLINIKRLANDR
jgi:hypothetical protein